MKNNIEFWNNYNKKCIEKINNLIQEKTKNKQDIFVDFHIHSNYSSDGKQSLAQILQNAQNKKIDIISVTDHDDVRVYNQLFELIKNGDLPNYPIVVTGIEHTVSYSQYGTMCHILKHFINPKNVELNEDIQTLNNSYFERAKLQIKRIFENSVLYQVIKDNNITISYEDFLNYLKQNNIEIPDYMPLINYIADKLKEKNVKTLDIFEKLKIENEKDLCLPRKKLKQERYEIMWQRHKDEGVQDNRKFLLGILAVRGVDEANYKDFVSTGSLSIDDYGQPNIFKLNKNGVTTFAHPTEKSVNSLLNCADIGGKLVGIENNFKNKYNDFNNFLSVQQKMELIELKGSDCHSLSEKVYENMDHYKMEADQLKNYINKVNQMLKSQC